MYTRRGDAGETSLYGPGRVSKDSPLVEAYGTIDELNSLFGVVISGCTDSRISAPLKAIQAMLFVAGADAACEFRSSRKVPRINHGDTLKLEEMTDGLLASLPRLRNFIMPGGSGTGAGLQFARAVCRRAERRIVSASKATAVNPELLPFFNRLSTFLFNLSRLANRRARKKDVVWKG